MAELDGKEEQHYTYPLKQIKDTLLPPNAEGLTTSEKWISSDKSDTIINPEGPLREFRHVSEIEAELAKMNFTSF